MIQCENTPLIQKRLKGITMNFEPNMIIKMKKPHPCGANAWEILRVGMDFRLKCHGCGHQIMLPRRQVEKSFRGIVSL